MIDSAQSFIKHDLAQLAKDQSARYSQNQPFPHIVLEQLFDDPLLKNIAQEMSAWSDQHKIVYHDGQQKKWASKSPQALGEQSRLLIDYLNSKPFLQFLEQLSGIPQLIADPRLSGGGYHQTQPGGLLKIHADFHKHPQNNLHRRLNLLVYLNEDWQDSYGGHLELWDPSMKHCVQKILPIFNRTVIFSTTTDSYHGHPDPLTCPAGRSRRSLALYYYTEQRPEQELNAKLVNTTLFQARPGSLADKKALGFAQCKAFVRHCFKTMLPKPWVAYLRKRLADDTDLRN